MQLKNCGLRQFEKLSQNKKIICFGAGNFLREFCEKCNIVNKIQFIIDNNEKLWDTSLNIKNTNIKILSIENAIKQISKDDILLITAGYPILVEIYDQIKNMALNVDSVYLALCVLESNDTRKEIFPKLNVKFKLTEEMQIPKIIHYAWFGKNPIPEEFQQYIEGWKEKCPGFEIVKWDETNYDISKNKFMKQAYDAKMWGFVPDYLRKDVVYEYGGIYLDTDVEVVKNLEDLLFQDGFCGFSYSSYNTNINFGLKFYIAFGLGFGARKHLQILKNLRDAYNDLEFYNDNKFSLTGPLLETKELRKYGLKMDGSYQHIKGLTIYPPEVLSGTNMITGETFINENTYTVHHYAATWFEEAKRRSSYNRRNFFTEIMKT